MPCAHQGVSASEFHECCTCFAAHARAFVARLSLQRVCLVWLRALTHSSQACHTRSFSRKKRYTLRSCKRSTSCPNVPTVEPVRTLLRVHWISECQSAHSRRGYEIGASVCLDSLMTRHPWPMVNCSWYFGAEGTGKNGKGNLEKWSEGKCIGLQDRDPSASSPSSTRFQVCCSHCQVWRHKRTEYRTRCAPQVTKCGTVAAANRR